MTWTLFWDMHSGGSAKEKWTKIYIEAPEKEAIVIFYNRFGHSPHRVSCTCCGSDYSIDESETLAFASGFHRECNTLVTPRGEDGKYIQPDDPWFHAHYYLDREDEEEAKRRGYKIKKAIDPKRYQTLAQYASNPDVLIIYKEDIKPDERIGEVPAQGYVWVD